METFSSYAVEILTLLFLIVTFLQSGIDKLTDWKGNVNFISDHFKSSPLKNSVPFLVGIILVLELVASILMILGVYDVFFNGSLTFAFYGAQLSALTLIFMLIGQRLAKDYAGAMTLAVYFIINMFLLYLLQ